MYPKVDDKFHSPFTSMLHIISNFEEFKNRSITLNDTTISFKEGILKFSHEDYSIEYDIKSEYKKSFKEYLQLIDKEILAKVQSICTMLSLIDIKRIHDPLIEFIYHKNPDESFDIFSESHWSSSMDTLTNFNDYIEISTRYTDRFNININIDIEKLKKKLDSKFSLGISDTEGI